MAKKNIIKKFLKKADAWACRHFDVIMAIIGIAILIWVAYATLWAFDHSPVMMKNYGNEVKAHWKE